MTRTCVVLIFLLASMQSVCIAGVKISTFGTSITAGNRWPPMLAAALTRCGMGPVELFNHGRAGATAVWGAQNVAAAVGEKPDILLIEFAVNDALIDWGEDLPTAERLTVSIVKTARQLSPATKIYLVTTSEATGAAAAGRPRLDGYYAMYRRVARDEGIGLIDTAARWDLRDMAELRDGLHPTKRGYARVFVPTIMATLAPRCTEGSQQRSP